jgi:hypothetical protein
MAQGKFVEISVAQRTEVWRRWKAGESLHWIGRAFDRPHTSIHCLLAHHGGIMPAVRRRQNLSRPKLPMRIETTVRERRKISKVTLLGGLGILLCGFLWVKIERPTRQAQRFMRDLQQLGVGNATFEDVKELADSDGGTAISIGNEPLRCSAEYCLYAFSFYNTWLHRLGLAPDMGLIAFLTVQENRLNARQVFLVCNGRTNFHQVFVREQLRSHTGQDYKLVSCFGVPQIGIELTPNAPLDLRKAAFQVNLSKIGGCAEPHDRIPAIPLGVQIDKEREH